MFALCFNKISTIANFPETAAHHSGVTTWVDLEYNLRLYHVEIHFDKLKNITKNIYINFISIEIRSLVQPPHQQSY